MMFNYDDIFMFYKISVILCCLVFGIKGVDIV